MTYVLFSEATGEVELNGTAAELGMLVDLLRSGAGTVELEAVADPSPYEMSLEAVVISREDRPHAQISVKDSRTLLFAGDRQSLALVADNIDSFAVESDAGGHWHLEYHPGHYYLAPESASVVIHLVP